MSADSVPFLQPGIAWALVVLFSVFWVALGIAWGRRGQGLSLIHISEPTRPEPISYAVFCLKK